MSVFQLGQAAARGALGRTFFIEKTTSGQQRVLLVFDVVTSEVPEFEADVTLLPVEEGPETTDHIQLKNPILKLEGTISETPLDLEVAAINAASGGREIVANNQARSNFLTSRVDNVAGIAGATLQGRASSSPGDVFTGAVDQLARTVLLAAYERRSRFTVVTRRQQYENMVLRRLSFPHTTDTGRQLQFSLEFQEIRIAAPFRVNVDQIAESASDSGASEARQGSQVSRTASEAETAQQNTSILFDIRSFFGG